MSASLCGKLEADVEIKASPSKFHHMFKHKPHHISNVSSSKIQGCELHEGDWGTVGSVIYWNYFHDGQARVAKDIVEAIDDKKNSITLRVLEGDVLDHFKSFLLTFEANPKPKGEGSVVHWTFEYEKHHDEIIDPHSLIEFAVELSKDIEAHLLEENFLGKVEADVEIKASPSKFHHMIKHKPYHLSNVSADKILGCELHESDWGTVGSVISWNYFLDGKARVAKAVVEAIDDEKNLIIFRMIEGDLMEHFKFFIFTVRANPKPDGEGSVVHLTMEYEKHHDEIIDPHTLLQLTVEVSKDLDAHLLEDN